LQGKTACLCDRVRPPANERCPRWPLGFTRYPRAAMERIEAEVEKDLKRRVKIIRGELTLLVLREGLTLEQIREREIAFRSRAGSCTSSASPASKWSGNSGEVVRKSAERGTG
jgi:hypothetical protein